MMFKIRDTSGERKYLITASNLAPLTLNKSSENVLLKCSFICFIYYYSIFCLDLSPGGGGFLTLLIDLSFPTRGDLIKKFLNFSNPRPLPGFTYI